jgi:uncharacterized protein (TIGR03086 family)
VSEVSDRYGRIVDGFGSRLARVGSDQWDDPTPCTEWNVRALVEHVIETQLRVVSMVAGSIAGSIPGSAPSEDEPVSDAAARWGAATERVCASLADPERASATVGGSFGEQSFESLVSRLLCADALFHTWDLARATGQDEHLDPRAVAKAMEFLEPLDEAIRRPGGFGAKLESPPDADRQTQLLQFGGRAVV